MSKEMRSKPDHSWKWMLAITGIITIAVIILSVHAGLNPSGAGEIINSLSGNVSAEAAELLSKAEFAPPALCGFIINPQSETNYFDFVLDTGDDAVVDKEKLTPETKELINYFFLGITLPAREFWVNLNPVELNSIISPMLICTGLGKMLLETDLRLKRDAAMLTDPRLPCGKEYWDVLKAELNAKNLSNAQIPANTRLWIIPADAVIEEDKDNKDKVILVGAKLKVCLESEYAPDLAVNGDAAQNEEERQIQDIASQAMKKVILPIIEFRVNYSKDYAQLRQIYQSLILAEYFKHKYWGKQSIYESYINTSSAAGLESKEGWSKEAMFDSYIQSMTKGEYSCIQQEYDPAQAAIIKRHYFSGGMLFSGLESGLAQGMTPVGPGVVSSGIGGTGDLIAQATTGAGAGGKVVVEDINLLTPEEAEAQRTAASPLNPVKYTPPIDPGALIFVVPALIATYGIIGYLTYWEVKDYLTDKEIVERISTKEVLKEIKQKIALFSQKDKIQLTEAQQIKVQELLKEIDKEREWVKSSVERFSASSDKMDKAAALLDMKATVNHLMKILAQLDEVIPRNDSTAWVHKELMQLFVTLDNASAALEKIPNPLGSSPIKTKVAAALLTTLLSFYSGTPTIPTPAPVEQAMAAQLEKQTVEQETWEDKNYISIEQYADWKGMPMVLSGLNENDIYLIFSLETGGNYTDYDSSTYKFLGKVGIGENGVHHLKFEDVKTGEVVPKTPLATVELVELSRNGQQLVTPGMELMAVKNSLKNTEQELMKIIDKENHRFGSGPSFETNMKAKRVLISKMGGYLRGIATMRPDWARTESWKIVQDIQEWLRNMVLSRPTWLGAPQAPTILYHDAPIINELMAIINDCLTDLATPDGKIAPATLGQRLLRTVHASIHHEDDYYLPSFDPDRSRGLSAYAYLLTHVERQSQRLTQKLQDPALEKKLTKLMQRLQQTVFPFFVVRWILEKNLRADIENAVKEWEKAHPAEQGTTVTQPGTASSDIVKAPNKVGGIDLRKIRYRVVFSEG